MASEDIMKRIQRGKETLHKRLFAEMVKVASCSLKADGFTLGLEEQLKDLGWTTKTADADGKTVVRMQDGLMLQYSGVDVNGIVRRMDPIDVDLIDRFV